VSEAHIAWTLVGAAAELSGLLLLYAVIRRRRRAADGEGLLRRVLVRTSEAWDRAWEEFRRTVENPAAPVSRPAELRGSAAATSAASGVISIAGIANETELQAVQRRVAELRTHVENQGADLARMRESLERQLAATQAATVEARDEFQAELARRDEQDKQRERRNTQLEVVGSILFVIGVAANVVANLIQ
jgi:hypothetical protein